MSERITKKVLAEQYSVSVKTINNWLKPIKGLELKTNVRILTPKQVELIYKHLGEP